MSNATAPSGSQSDVGIESEPGRHTIVSVWPFQDMTSEEWHVWSGLHWITGFSSSHVKQIAQLRLLIPMAGDRFDAVLDGLEHKGYVIRMRDGGLYLPDERPKFMEHMAHPFEEYDHD